MKTLIAALLMALSTQASAITIYGSVPAGATTINNGNAVIGLRKVEIGRYWTWHGKARKYDYQPLYSTTPVPEAGTYAMLLAGLGLVAWRVKWRA